MTMRRSILLLAMLLVPGAVHAKGANAAADPTPNTVTTITVERERPTREKLPTLRFLRANRDFIRARFDRLREHASVDRAPAASLDPRFLAYRKLLADIAASKDSVVRASDARERHDVFTSIEDLAALEQELDQMERLLHAQRARLGVLRAAFGGR